MNFQEKVAIVFQAKRNKNQKILKVFLSPNANKQLNQAYHKGFDVPKYIKEMGGIPVIVDSAYEGVRALVQYEGAQGLLMEENIFEERDLGRQTLYDAGVLE